VTGMLATILVLLSLSMAAVVGAAQISDTDRQRLVSHLEMTGSWLLDEVSTLSRGQLEFRRAPGTWNIGEVVEHLVVVGEIYWQDLQKALKGPPLKSPLPGGDADILWYGIDRTYREKALASELPKGPLRDLQAALETYRRQHARLLQYARTTKDDLRNRYVERQHSDAYQWALLISTHEQRHILQIREIKADPVFPRK
jgi:hypothetical protein